MNVNKWILPHERVDDLQLNGLKIIQNPKGFCFGIDAVLLSNFVTLKKNDIVVEFGTGTGIIPILLSGKSKFKKITAFEVQDDVAEMAKRSVAINQLEDRIEIINDNLKSCMNYLKPCSVDVVITNPPYMSPGAGLKNNYDQKSISRHEILCTLEDIVEQSSKLLKFGGKLFMIHRPQRLVDIMVLSRKYNLEPKEIRMIQPYANKKPNIFLLMCTKGGNSELKFKEPLIVYEKNGEYTQEIYDIYGMENISVFNNQKKECDES